MTRLAPLATTCGVLAVTLGLTGCGRSSHSDTPSVPAAVALSPDGVRQVSHTFSPDGQRIAYWSPVTDVPDRWQLWVANSDLSAPMKLPVTAANTTPAFWSPDGQRLLAPSSDYGVAQVVMVPASGGEVRRVTQGSALYWPISWFRGGEGVNYYGSTPETGVQSFVFFPASGQTRPLVPSEKRPTLGAVSPDGSHVAYFVVDGSTTTVWVADGDGSHPRQLTTEGFESTVQYQEWSPDGKEVLYLSRRTGHNDLWVVPIDGGKARQLTRDVRDDYAGAWSPDGKWIAFLSNRGGQRDVWLVPAAGGTEQRVTDTAAEEQWLVWRPGTNTLTFDVQTQENGVWAMDVASGAQRRLTPESQRVTQFRPSPDGREVLYLVEKGANVQALAVSPTAGGAARLLVEGGGSIQGPEWSPDGKTIAFGSDRGGSWDVWAVDASGGAALRQVTNWPGFEGGPAWTSDGSAIYFLSDKDAKLEDVWRVPAAGGDPVRVTTAGNTIGIRSARGQAGFFVGTISTKGGQIALSLLKPDRSSTVIWDKTTVNRFDAAGDSVVAEVEGPDGKMQSMILAADGRGGRVILKSGETPTALSKDGQWIVYELAAGGAKDLGLLHVADGAARRLTTTPESEEGAEFTSDGKTVLFRRVKTVQRITAVDISALLAGKQ